MSIPDYMSLRSKCAHWCGNPPVRAEMFRKLPRRLGFAAIIGCNRYPVPFNRGIATPVCALVRNDSIFRVRTRKHQFVVLTAIKNPGEFVRRGFVRFYLRRNRTPRQLGPQWLDMVQPAEVTRTSRKGCSSLTNATALSDRKSTRLNSSHS